MNKYLVKIASNVGIGKEAGIGFVGKSLIRDVLGKTKLNTATRGAAANVEAISRSSAGSKVAPKAFSASEYNQHGSAMSGLAKKFGDAKPMSAGNMQPDQANKIFSVGARAKRMGMDLSKLKIRTA